jgi:hypothetical protein
LTGDVEKEIEMGKKKTPKLPKRRNMITYNMGQRYHRQRTTHPDKKKQASKNACRSKVRRSR